MKNLSFIIAVGLALGACNSNNEDMHQQSNTPVTEEAVNLDELLAEGPSEKTSIPLSADDKKSCEAANSFAFKLYEAITTDSQADNIVVSPMSVFNTLSMLANGDKSGEVRDEILTLCNTSSGDEGLKQLNRFNNLMHDYLPCLDNKSVCYFANAIMHAPSTDIYDDYLSAVSAGYNAENIPIAPTGIVGMETVNEWVSEKTNGMISNFLKSPLNDYVAIINAAYFKAAWASHFNEEDNHNEDFGNCDGSVAQIPFMHNNLFANYAETEFGRYLELNYGYGNYNFCAILPSQNNRYITREELQAFENIVRYEPVDLSMPKFDFQNDFDLSNLLGNLGLNKLASKGLDGIAKDEVIPIDSFLHSAAITVNEKGAEAGAATYAGMLMANDQPLDIEPIKFSLNQPFLFFIKENSSGVILYMGAVNKL